MPTTSASSSTTPTPASTRSPSSSTATGWCRRPTLLDETLRVRHPAGVVELPAGQVELVATDRAYEGRGLVRALMSWAHERSAARGHDLQVMIGIPYFYRRFGYEYAIDIPPARLSGDPPQSPARRSAAVPTTSRAGPAAGRRPGGQRRDDAPPGCEWRWTLGGTGTTTWVAERAGEVVAPVAAGR